MALKDVLVHVNSSEHCKARLKVAAAFAKKNDARLTGLFTQAEAKLTGKITHKVSKWLLNKASEMKGQFEKACNEAGIKGEWHQVACVYNSEVIQETIVAARHCDMIILGQYDPEKEHLNTPPELVEQVVLNAGRPALILPFTENFKRIGKRTLIAWNGGRESARALNDSMNLIKGAKSVKIFAMNHVGEVKRKGHSSYDDVVSHLATHGIKAEKIVGSAADIGVMDMILSTATDEVCDLLVMGAHGQYGFPNLHKGGGTRYILQHMTLPVLMSH